MLAVFGEVQAAKAVVERRRCASSIGPVAVAGEPATGRARPSPERSGDVRALMFMNPLNTTRASTLLADLALPVPTDVRVNPDTVNTINHTKTDKESIT